MHNWSAYADTRLDVGKEALADFAAVSGAKAGAGWSGLCDPDPKKGDPSCSRSRVCHL